MSQRIGSAGSRTYLRTALVALTIPALHVGCAAAPPPPPVTARADRASQLAAARRLAGEGWRATASAIYQTLLSADPNDDEARAGVARLEAWQGRYDDADARYRAILSRHPDDAEVRAGLVDTLLWRARWDDARAQIDEGLRRAPESAPLLERLARLHAWHGDAPRARAAIDRAARAAPDDPDLSVLRDRTFVGEARLIGRYDLFPASTADTGAVDLFVSQSLGRLTLVAHSEQSMRLVTGGTAYNGMYSLAASYAFGVGWGASLEAGFGAPAPVIPAWTARASVTAALARPLSASLAYAFWSYASGQRVQLVNPALSLTVTDTLRFEARYWLALVASPGLDLAAVHTAGLRAVWRVAPRVDVGAEYLFGNQVDRVPTADQLTTLQSHIGSAWLDWLASRAFGLRPLYRLERRENLTTGAAYLIHSVEASVYTRW